MQEDEEGASSLNLDTLLVLTRRFTVETDQQSLTDGALFCQF